MPIPGLPLLVGMRRELSSARQIAATVPMAEGNDSSAMNWPGLSISVMNAI